jgi:hypothetical protein
MELFRGGGVLVPDSEPRLQSWMRFGQPIETVLNDYRRVFDAWEVMGVRGIVVGRLLFRDENGSYHAIFRPNPRVYQRLGVQPPSPPDREFPERRRQFDELLAEARRRGWPVLVFAPDAGAGPGGGNKYHLFARPQAWAARILDTLEQFPAVTGGIIDGPEWGYEIEPGHRSNIFADLPDPVKPLAESMHYDFAELRDAVRRLEERLHRIDDRAARAHSESGFTGTARFFGSDPVLTAWLRFRTEVLTGTVKMLKGLMREQRSELKLGMGPRSAAFAPLCGYDFRALMQYLDFLLPKHYFWRRGVDGFYGTIYRWMSTLVAWNPGLSEEAALEVVQGFFGIELPGVSNALDFERGFPDEFFTQIVTKETQAALAAVDDPQKVVPWVDVGRRPHGGDPMGTGDFIRLLSASAKAGLRRFLFHGHAHLTPAEAEVIRAFCGDPSRPFPAGYEPPDGRLPRNP